MRMAEMSVKEFNNLMKKVREFKETEFYEEVCNLICKWNKALTDGDNLAGYYWAQWQMAKKALKHIVGLDFELSRTKETFGIKTEDDFILVEFNFNKI